MSRRSSFVDAVLTLVALTASAATSAEPWKPAPARLTTPWTATVTPENAWREYPRPQLTRPDWQSLNGLWDFAVTRQDAEPPAAFDRRILVPFPVEAPLSGVGRIIEPHDRMWYRRTFTVPESWQGRRVLLHFEAVDWETVATVNGREVGRHRGGYDPFSFDVTDALKPGGEQELLVAVHDPTAAGFQPVGKQSMNPGGCFYTRSSGIWQTVWLEPVAAAHVTGFRAVTDPAAGRLTLRVDASAADADVEVAVNAAGKTVATTRGRAGADVEITIPNPRAWSPDDPFLHDLAIRLSTGGRVRDEVRGYVGMRSIAVGKDDAGITRILLNGRFVFQVGPLDQGFWPDGLHTPPCEEAVRQDLDLIRRSGFNMLRKHIKVESRRYYHLCDTLGLLVWQDMPSLPLKEPSPEAKKNFAAELERMIATHASVPSIVMWVPFNEAWGQHDTKETVELIRRLDPTRLIDNASGWVDEKVGDILDHHTYPGPGEPKPEPTRAAVLGEYGGLGLNIPDHMWAADGWGYAAFHSLDALNDRFEEITEKLLERVRTPGISGAVYTQTSDIEMENNGLVTYDRKIVKIDPERCRRALRGWLAPRPAGAADRFIDTLAVDLVTPLGEGVIRYTLDGSDPTDASPQATGPVILRDSCTLKARADYDGGTGTSRVAAFAFRKVPAHAAVAAAGTRPGLFMRSFATKGSPGAIPDLEKAETTGSFVVAAPGFEFAPRQGRFALRFEGFFTAPETGVYTFFCSSDDGSRLVVAGETVFDDDGHAGFRQRHGSVALAKGPHRFALDYGQIDGHKALTLECEGPGIARGGVKPAMFAHVKPAPVTCLPPAMDGPTAKFLGETTIRLACPYKDAEIRFTTDGSEPGPDSPRYGGPVKIAASTTVRARAFAADMVASPPTTIQYTAVAPHPPAPAADLEPGIAVAAYRFDRMPERMPDFAALEPVSTAVVQALAADQAPPRDNVGLVYEGFVTVPATGLYAFRLAADDEAQLTVAGETTIERAHYTDDWEGASPRVGFVALEAGAHPLTLRYYQGNGGRRLALEIEGPGLSRRRIEGPMLHHRPRP